MTETGCTARGAKHTLTLDSLNNLRLLYFDQGKMKEAEERFLRALTGKEKAWGAEHTSTLDTVNSLGVLYCGQGNMKETEEMFLRALTGKEKAWGAEHTSTLETVNSFGSPVLQSRQDERSGRDVSAGIDRIRDCLES